MKPRLQDYEAKRRFDVTPEPRGRAARWSARLPDGAASFVIQRHDARRLHYDFRLELDGALKSWAVPKGPSLDPAVKRLAVHVEDHPLDYGTFEGRIPEGSYGAGTVAIWDHGVWRPEGGLRGAREGYARGVLKFMLEGDKLHGGWALVRSPMHDGKHENWLLIKQRDEEAVSEEVFHVVDDATSGSAHAGRGAKAKTKMKAKAQDAPLPATLAPQLATPAEALPHGDNWLYELKFDGYRVLARIERQARGKHDVRIFTRTGNDWTAKFPRQVQALHALDLDSAWLDGEAVVLDANGVPDFQALQNAFDAGRADAITFWLFDVPWLDGRDLRGAPLDVRRAKLSALLAAQPHDALRFSEAFEGEPQTLLTAACEANLEGLVAKRRDSRYTSTRSAAWLKLRCARRQEFVIGGYTAPKGGREGFGALLIGVYDGEGALQYAGKVGTGFDATRLDSLAAELRKRERKRSPFAAVPAAGQRAGAHWVRPDLVAEVRFKTWTSAGVVRQASFAGLREDKPARSIVREAQVQPVSKASGASKGVGNGASHARSRSPGRAAHDEAEVAGVRITHPERVIDARSGLRKIDLVRYFEWIAPWLLPQLKRRPVALARAPRGVGGELFFQKHAKALQIPHATQHAGLDPGHAPLLTLDSARALVGAAQMDAIELHTWNALTTNIEKPDRIVFDLDPGASLAWERMLEAAQLTHELLEALGLRAWCKTSGGKGLHVVVPLTRHAGWDEVKDFARVVANYMAATLPERFSARMGAQNRKGRVFVDYLRNGRGASTIAAYAPRARPGLGVSVPVGWDELHTLTSGDQWNVANLRERLEGPRADAWRDYGAARQRITASMWRLLGTK
ncbi:DNA ligase D [Paraburkholderia unamae]|uniref:DNA ligase (ATP) n=1 Tax=Paraburkholderia unamae TaxID=219649 RepID=A0ABX5KTJ3_9BURK|nr:DNA ligase D [Paraburkholderia unamae]PVX85089.1 ATP-dependent DNA ligase LigD phosphoesterase module /ATP-dependent DNA ligase LigD polymerase module [Paraburkholderia unamae]CAG9245028.1 3'-phosphoesterase / DNA ligase D / DNA repair polymerase [Paraburkholderia unamae]